MTTREQHRQAAATRHDLDRAAHAILQRGGEPEHVWQALLAAITGRYELREIPKTTKRCEKHPFTTPIGGGVCPLCGPGD